MPQNEKQKDQVTCDLVFVWQEATKKKFFAFYIKVSRTPTGYEINERVKNILIDKLEFDTKCTIISCFV